MPSWALSAALIGSGMAFRYDLFRDTMADIKAVGGFDRELELTLLYRGKRFYYLPETFVSMRDTEHRRFLPSAPPLAVGTMALLPDLRQVSVEGACCA